MLYFWIWVSTFPDHYYLITVVLSQSGQCFLGVQLSKRENHISLISK